MGIATSGGLTRPQVASDRGGR